MVEKNDNKIEREYIIPLKEKIRVVPRYKKTNKAVRTIKEFLVRHMKIRDRDLKKVKIDKYLNEVLWHRGIRKPPIKIKVRAIKEGDIVRAELVDMPEKIKFKKLREEKIVKQSKEIIQGKKSLVDKAKEAIQKKPEEEQEEKKEDKEREKTGIEATQLIEKAAAKQAKHQGKRIKEPKHQRRMALAK